MNYLFITGKTKEGIRFRPSDWSERLFGCVKSLDMEEYEACKGLVHLINLRGNKGILISTELEEVNPRLYLFFQGFIDKNNLQVESITK